MNESGKSREIIDISDMRLIIQHSLVVVSDAPALRDVKAQYFGKLVCRLARDGVAPGAEFSKLFSVLVERQIAVHHGGNADAADFIHGNAELLFDVSFQVCKTGLKACLDQVG